MADMTHLAFTISGGGAQPSGVRLRDLLVILAEFETAVIATARHMGSADDEAFLSLTTIKSGSAVYDMVASPQSQKAAGRIATAINHRNSESLPQQAVHSLGEIHKRAIKMGRSFVINNSQFTSVIEPSIPLFSDALIQGATSIFGYLNAIGGTRPTAKIKLADDRHITAEVATLALAQELAQHLYHDIELEGDAWWHAGTMELRRFRIRKVGTFDDSIGAEQAFSELAEVSPGLWDSVDPDEYIGEQRSELPQ